MTINNSLPLHQRIREALDRTLEYNIRTYADPDAASLILLRQDCDLDKVVEYLIEYRELKAEYIFAEMSLNGHFNGRYCSYLRWKTYEGDKSDTFTYNPGYPFTNNKEDSAVDAKERYLEHMIWISREQTEEEYQQYLKQYSNESRETELQS